MKDLRIELRAKNNVLWHAVFDTYVSVSAFCRAHGLSQIIVGGFINLTWSPYSTHGRGRESRRLGLRSTAAKLCTITGFSADELFPRTLYQHVVNPKTAIELDAVTFLPLMAARAQHSLEASPDELLGQQERQQALARVLLTLTPREEAVVRQRFGLDGNGERTLDEVGGTLNVTAGRIRQIEAKALRKLRHPSRSRQLRAWAGQE